MSMVRHEVWGVRREAWVDPYHPHSSSTNICHATLRSLSRECSNTCSTVLTTNGIIYCAYLASVCRVTPNGGWGRVTYGDYEASCCCVAVWGYNCPLLTTLEETVNTEQGQHHRCVLHVTDAIRYYLSHVRVGWVTIMKFS